MLLTKALSMRREGSDLMVFLGVAGVPLRRVISIQHDNNFAKEQHYHDNNSAKEQHYHDNNFAKEQYFT